MKKYILVLLCFISVKSYCQSWRIESYLSAHLSGTFGNRTTPYNSWPNIPVEVYPDQNKDHLELLAVRASVGADAIKYYERWYYGAGLGYWQRGNKWKPTMAWQAIDSRIVFTKTDYLTLPLYIGIVRDISENLSINAGAMGRISFLARARENFYYFVYHHEARIRFRNFVPGMGLNGDLVYKKNERTWVKAGIFTDVDLIDFEDKSEMIILPNNNKLTPLYPPTRTAQRNFAFGIKVSLSYQL